VGDHGLGSRELPGDRGDAFAVASSRPSTRLIVGRPAVLLSGGAMLSAPVSGSSRSGWPDTLVVDGYGSSESGGQGRALVARGSLCRRSRFTIDATTGRARARLEARRRGYRREDRRRGRVPLGYHKDARRSRSTFPVIDGERWAIRATTAIVEPTAA